MKKAMKIKVINRSAYALPQYETAGAAGMDVRADIRESIWYRPDFTSRFRTDTRFRYARAAVWPPDTASRS